MSDNREEIIKDAIESIEPGEGSRERMLVNIMRKAAEQYENENISDSPAKKKMEENKRYTKKDNEMGSTFGCMPGAGIGRRFDSAQDDKR